MTTTATHHAAGTPTERGLFMAFELSEKPCKSCKPLTGHADGGEQRRHSAILTSCRGARYPYQRWCLVPVWTSGSGRLRPRRW
jgi:hypothetical protein